MSIKNVEQIFSPKEPHYVGDGFRVHNFIPSIPSLKMDRMNPFLLMDYNATFYFPPSQTPRGVGVHPHRGFETVTIAYKGKVAHHDSTGNHGVIHEGDVQWMTAASGILHKEYHEEGFSKKGGEFQMVQLWVNLPAKFKMSPPKYQGIANLSIPKYAISNNGGVVEIIAGEHKGLKGAAFTFSPVNLLNVKLQKGSSEIFSFPIHYNSAILVIEGKISINNTHEAFANHFVLLDKKGENFTIEANENSIALILSGEPINEPIATYGPFVMNTSKELMQAIEDFNAGKFGYLED
jgi:hypothetical protein